MSKTALLFGSSGLTGSELLQQLLRDERYNAVKVFNRRSTNARHNKLDEYVIDFNNLPAFGKLFTGDVVFCCLGTTIKKAGSKEAFKAVDYELPKQIASITSGNGIPCCAVISAIGANAGSSNFYLRTKGEMEKAVKAFKFEKRVFIHPSFILGNRNEARAGESFAKFMGAFISPLLMGSLKKYKPVHASQIAAAMRNLPFSSFVKEIAEYDDIIELAGQG